MLVSVSEYAIQVGLSAPAVRRLCREGHIASVKIGPRLWRIPDDQEFSRPIPISRQGEHPTNGRLR